MTGAAQEIEVKYRVTDLGALEAALAGRGVILSLPVPQDDQAYAQPGWEHGQPKIGVTFARLRTQDGRHLFTVKKPIANEMACLEWESEVADRAQMHQAILLMGFRPTVRIVKTRRIAHADGLTVCVDDVELAGVFMEIEQTVEADRPGVVVQAELDAWTRSLGVELERVTDTYDSLVRSGAGI